MTSRPLDCGSCNACCKLLHVPDIQKPAHMLCWHTTVHGGCAVQAEKSTDPALAACAQFRCVWLASQDQGDGERWVRSARPDQCHVMFGPRDRDDEMLVYVHVDPRHPDAWRDLKLSEHIRRVIAAGGHLEVIIGEQHIPLGTEYLD